MKIIFHHEKNLYNTPEIKLFFSFLLFLLLVFILSNKVSAQDTLKKYSVELSPIRLLAGNF